MSMWDMMVERTSGKEYGALQPENLRASTVGNAAIPSPDDTVCKADILFVATNLDSWEADDIRYGREVMLDVCYRQLDAPYYAYLRHMMAVARDQSAEARIPPRVYDKLRSRFNALHAWVIEHIGEETLVCAVNRFDINSYVPHSYAAYRKRCDDEWHARTARNRRLAGLDQAGLLAWYLSTRGYAAIKSNVLDDIVIFVSDDSVVIPDRWSDKVRFTVDELNLMTGSSPEAVKQIHEVKRKFGGKLVSPEDCPFEVAATSENTAVKARSASPAQLRLAVTN
ncbi:MAG: hypothetical protein ABFD49_07145 [Armatimonadota bacterium]|nr:hypothetical protein [bacterium]